jgi:hypothetical protein
MEPELDGKTTSILVLVAIDIRRDAQKVLLTWRDMAACGASPSPNA